MLISLRSSKVQPSNCDASIETRPILRLQSPGDGLEAGEDSHDSGPRKDLKSRAPNVVLLTLSGEFPGADRVGLPARSVQGAGDSGPAVIGFLAFMQHSHRLLRRAWPRCEHISCVRLALSSYVLTFFWDLLLVFGFGARY